MFWASVVLGLLIIALVCIKFGLSSNKCSAPKCPRGHWLWGYTKLPLEDWAPLFFKWSREKGIGSVFQFSVLPFSYPIVVVNDIKTVKDVMNRRDFAGRVKARDAGTIAFNPEGAGIAGGSPSPAWKELQRFTMSTLSAMGFGRARMESAVLEEADALVDAFNNTQGQPFDPDGFLQLAVSNVICKVVFGLRFEFNEKSALLENVFAMIPEILHLSFKSPYNLGPTRLLMKLFPPKQLKTLNERTAFFKSFVDESLENHEAMLKEEGEPSEPRDLIEAILLERRRRPEAEVLNRDNVQHLVFDLFFAGTDTTSTFLSWALAWLLHRADVRKKLIEEIRNVLGDDGSPTLASMKDFHYLHSFCDEVHRRSSIVDTGVPHVSVNPSSQLAGFNIPSHKMIFTNIWGIHHDPDVWEDPMEFIAHRFLDADGKYCKSDNVIPFGIGHRRCLGEKLARLETFTFLVRILQKVDFKLGPGSEMPAMFGRKPSFVRSPEMYKIIAT